MEKVICKVALLTILCFSGSLSSMGEDVLLIENTKLPTEHTGMPRKPKKNMIVCDYQCGILTFPSSFDGTLSVTIECEETMETWYGIINESTTTLEFTSASGIYLVTCITEDNRTFTGVINQ